MSYQPVFDSKILSARLFTAKSGRSFQLFTLSCLDFSFQPGQFIMVQEQENGFFWSYPYMIYHAENGELQVIAGSSSTLFKHKTGNPVSFWGANGRGCSIEENELFIAEPAALPLILPLILACKNPRLFLLGTKEDVPFDLLCPSTVFFSQPHKICEKIIEISATEPVSSIYTALNLSVLEDVIKDVPPALTERIFIFAKTQIGCGIGACKACYLHSPDIHMGIPVCCNGPYLPYLSIDFAKDKKCFQQIR